MTFWKNLASGRGAYLLVSLLLLVPCYWQPRLQAGDLSSHIYNAWLAQLIESGRAEGLMVVRQTTNVLFDLMLSGLFRLFGAELAQRLAVSVAVLTFVWGAFAFVSAVAGRQAWHLLPCLAMLGYGWVFHMGFFNFYLSMGLCFGAMALLWTQSPRRILPAAGLLVAAYSAHVLPVFWCLGLLAYMWVANRLSVRSRAGLTGLVVLAMAAFQVTARQFFTVRWSAAQLTTSTGVDQVWIFDSKYYLVLAGLLAIWGILFLQLVRGRGPRAVVSGIPFHLCVIAAAAVFVLPGMILLPGYSHSLSYIAERMSLGVAVCVCALLGGVEPRTISRYGLVAIAIVFFGFVYGDERALNAFEDRMQDAISQLAPGDRVVSIIEDNRLRSNSVSHMIDRVCIGRCFSYANYEASTKQFRIRAIARNRIVAAQYKESFHLQIGDYVIQDRDLPLYALDIEPTGRFVLKVLRPGMTTGTTQWNTRENRPYS